MIENDKILCACSIYNNKFWINNKFPKLPDKVIEELKIMSVLFVEDVGGIIVLRFDDDGNLYIDVKHDENDYNFDEIGAGLKIKELRKNKEELFLQLELYYRTFVKGKNDTRN